MKRVVLALVGGLVAYELVALSEKRRGDTISEIVWTETSHYAILPFAFGVLMGHFFWQRADFSSAPAPEVAPKSGLPLS